jgi:phosphohistidine phosphatase SixA
MTIHILRHADAIRQKPRPLSGLGIEQAHQIGIKLANPECEHLILTSPYHRTSQTADIIAMYVDTISVETLDLLREHESGEVREMMIIRARTALEIISSLHKFNPIVISHRAVIQAMVSEFYPVSPERIECPKAGGFILSTNGITNSITEWRL